MKNTIWKFNKKQNEWSFCRKEPELNIAIVYLRNGKYELPRSWFGVTKKHNAKYKKSIGAAKAAVEMWFENFIKSIS